MGDKLDAWLKTRPESVQKLAEEFPIGSVLEVEGEPWHLLGYTEADELIVSPLSPFVDYDAAYAKRELVCAKHYRGTPMADEKPIPKTTTVNWFEHVRKGKIPRVFQRRQGYNTPVPGDGIFAEVVVTGTTFACTILSNGDSGVEPEKYELAIRSLLACLCEMTETPQPKGVYVIPEGEMN